MKHSETITSVAAAVSALSTMVCCLPSGIAAAAGAAGLGVVVEPFRPWLVGLSIALLAVGFVQLYRSNRSCHRRSLASIAVFLISAVLVLGVLALPQITAGLFAAVFPQPSAMGRTMSIVLIVVGAVALAWGARYYLSGHQAPTGQPPLRELTSDSLDSLKAEFNRATEETRIILLLSPT